MHPTLTHARSLLVAAFAAALMALAVAGPAHAGQTRAVQAHLLWNQYDAADQERQLDQAREAGAGMVRVDLGWASLEQDGKGHWNSWYLNRIDHVVSEVLGADVVHRVMKRSRTRRLALRGAEGYEELRQAADGVSATVPGPVVSHLAERYGGEARTLIAMIERDKGLAEPLVPGLPYVRAEAVYAARYEMARSVDDVLSRRTRARLQARDASAAAAADVAALLAPELGWTKAEATRQAKAYVAAVAAERGASDLPVTGPAPAPAPARRRTVRT